MLWASSTKRPVLTKDNMKSQTFFFTTLILLFCYNLFSQDYCIPNRFVDNYYFKSRDIHVKKNIVYSKATNYKGKKTQLELDIYCPKESIDDLEYRPLIMLFHGGGFQRQDKEQTEKYCPLFAQRGFVTANINYRLGFSGETGDSTSLLAVYRAVQDAKAALNYLLDNSTKYGIDPNNVFIGGRSAGGVISLATSYIDQNEYNKAYLWFRATLGEIDKTTNSQRNGYTIKGVINMWGIESIESLISPLEVQEIPIIAFYGSKDPSYDKCLELTNYFKNNNGCYQLHSKIGAGHGEDMSKYYITAKTGDFIKRILCDSCISFEREINNLDLECDDPLIIDKVPKKQIIINVDNSILNQYIGQYKSIENRKDILRIILKNNQLLLQSNEDGPNTILYPESEIDFLIFEDNMQIMFMKNDRSKVTGLKVFIDAKEINFKKKK